MTKIVKAGIDVMLPFTVLYGAYIIVHGHLTPGGGFQGGAVMATSAALVLVARGWAETTKRIPKGALQLCETAGLVTFVLAGLSALVVSSPVFFNWTANAAGIFGDEVPSGANPGVFNAGGLIPVMNIAVGLEVVGALSIILVYMLSHSQEKAD